MKKTKKAGGPLRKKWTQRATHRSMPAGRLEPESMSPLQYASHMFERDGLKLPDPYLPAKKSGKYEIIHVPHKSGETLKVVTGRMAIFAGVEPAQMTLKNDWTETALQEDGRRFRSTHPVELCGIKYATDHAHDDILIGGLGMGLLLHELEGNTEVTSITCVESNRELIEFLSPYFPVVKFVNADLGDFMDARENEGKFDFIFIDAGGDSESQFYDDVAPLRVKAKKVMRNSSSKQDLVCWGEEVMRGQILHSILNAIGTKFDYFDDSKGSKESLRSFCRVNVDFFKKYGMLEPGDAATALVKKFVDEWEHGTSK